MSEISKLFSGSKDSTVSTLFSKSSEIKERPHQVRHAIKRKRKSAPEEVQDEEIIQEEDVEPKDDSSVAEETEPVQEEIPVIEQVPKRKKARKIDQDDTLEDRYLTKLSLLSASEKKDQQKKASEGEEGAENDGTEHPEDGDEQSASAEAKPAGLVDLKTKELEKADRTLFVGNIPGNVIESKHSTRLFKKYFAEAVGKSIDDCIESIRFRSIHRDTGVSRRAAFIGKEIIQDTSMNAYIVFKTTEDSLKPTGLNGREYLGNHLRVDHLGHPAKKDNRQCIFVGNIDFQEEDETLWTYFNKKLGDGNNVVTNVRLVRDPKTNFGKGFAIVQFSDSNFVEKALLLNGKPIEGSKKKVKNLRITRCKSNKTHMNTREQRQKKRARDYREKNLSERQKTIAGRARKVLGKSDKSGVGKVVFEGERAKKGDVVGTKKRKKPRTKKPRHLKD